MNLTPAERQDIATLQMNLKLTFEEAVLNVVRPKRKVRAPNMAELTAHLTASRNTQETTQ